MKELLDKVCCNTGRWGRAAVVGLVAAIVGAGYGAETARQKWEREGETRRVLKDLQRRTRGKEKSEMAILEDKRRDRRGEKGQKSS